MRDRHRPIASLPTMLCTLFVCLSLCVSFVWTYTPGNCTLEVGKNVIYWSNDTQVPEGKTVVNGTQIRVTCPKTGSDYDYDTTGEKVSEADIECIDGNFTDHGLVCENETKSSPETLPSPSKCTTIANGNITDRGKSFVCNQDFQPAFKNGMDAVLYTRYSCTCNQSSGRLQCMGTEVECKPIGCKIPANIQQGMELYDPRERRKISAANRYEIQHGYVLIFTCEPSDVFYFEPNQRMFECVKGSWVAKIRGGGTWEFGNNGSFPECRRVVCPADYCKFGGYCIRDHECQCPEQTSGKQCETPLCDPECQNGGTCVSPDTCQCTEGYNGLGCENDINECAPAPCKNGATCTNLQNAYSCACTPGWQGNNCDQDINECAPAQCKNGATCTNRQNAYSCTCVPGWQGNNCDQDINECAFVPCKNNATCSNLQNGYSCRCSPGWQGNNCDQDINECAPTPLYQYQVAVYTGSESKAGTDANVYLQIFGECGDTGYRRLLGSRTNLNKFEPGNRDVFEIVAVYLGKLTQVKIRHNGSGPGSGWLLDRVVVKETMETTIRYVFKYERWLDEGDRETGIEQTLALSEILVSDPQKQNMPGVIVSTGVIIGIVVGIFLVLVIIVDVSCCVKNRCGIFMCIRKKVGGCSSDDGYFAAKTDDVKNL